MITLLFLCILSRCHRREHGEHPGATTMEGLEASFCKLLVCIVLLLPYSQPVVKFLLPILRETTANTQLKASLPQHTPKAIYDDNDNKKLDC